MLEQGPILSSGGYLYSHYVILLSYAGLKQDTFPSYLEAIWCYIVGFP